MQTLNNLDIIILVVIAISSFLAFSRGILKELFSIVGWTAIIVITIFLLPILNEIVARYVDNVAVASVSALVFILVILFIFWMVFTRTIVGGIRKSKLSYFDRILGFIFGFARGVLLIVLFYIMVNWVAPKDYQTDTLKDSVYFQMAGVLAKPIEKLIPEETLKNIHQKSSIEEFLKDVDTEDGKSLFEQLMQPQIEKVKDAKDKAVDNLGDSADKAGEDLSDETE